MTTRLVQLRQGDLRQVALVEEPHLRLLSGISSIYSLANIAIERGVSLSATVKQSASEDLMPYDCIYECRSDWKILPAIDHPDQSARCLVSDTGLSHLGSARDWHA